MEESGSHLAATRAKEVATLGGQWLSDLLLLSSHSCQDSSEAGTRACVDRAMLPSAELCQCVQETGVQDTAQTEVSKQVSTLEAAS